jgi:branched-chain amino acid transport system permease protein
LAGVPAPVKPLCFFNTVKRGHFMQILRMVLPLTVVGVAMGTIYAFLGMGLILLIRAVGVLNFAQGDMLMLGAYVTAMLTLDFNMPLFGMFLVALVMFAISATLFMYLVYMPVRNSKWPAASMICTLGASLVIREGLILVYSAQPRVAPPLVEGLVKIKSVNIGTIVFEKQYLAIAILGSVIITAVFLLFDKLYCGKVMQAAAQDRYAGQLLGIPIDLTILATYIIVMVVSGTGGFLVAPLFMVSPTLGLMQGRAFAGFVIGGLGSLKGAVVGSIIVGLIENYSMMVTTQYKDAVVFAALLLMLAIRPQGLFGETIAEKA